MRSWMINRLMVSTFGLAAICSQWNLVPAQEPSLRANSPVVHSARAVLISPSLSSLQSTEATDSFRDANSVAEVSPSDQSASDAGVSKVQLAESDPSGLIDRQLPDRTLTTSDGEMLAPLQSRQLTISVQAVSTSSEKIGTGLVPQAGRPQWSDQELAGSTISRDSLFTQVYWQASLIQHYPLYFEDAMLERHGHTHCWRGWEVTQSLVSGAKFFGTITMLPYLRTLQPKHECVYALGHYRAGSAAPCLRSSVPYDRSAAIVESGSAAALFWGAPF